MSRMTINRDPLKGAEHLLASTRPDFQRQCRRVLLFFSTAKDCMGAYPRIDHQHSQV